MPGNPVFYTFHVISYQTVHIFRQQFLGPLQGPGLAFFFKVHLH